MLNKQSVAIEDIYVDPRIPTDAYRPTFVKSLAMVPIRTADPVGAIGNYWAHPHKPTTRAMRSRKLGRNYLSATRLLEFGGTISLGALDPDGGHLIFRRLHQPIARRTGDAIEKVARVVKGRE